MKTFLNILRAMLVLACVVTFIGLLSDLDNAVSAPQQAAAAAIAAAITIIPYIGLRAIEGFGSKEGK